MSHAPEVKVGRVGAALGLRPPAERSGCTPRQRAAQKLEKLVCSANLLLLTFIADEVKVKSNQMLIVLRDTLSGLSNVVRGFAQRSILFENSLIC